MALLGGSERKRGRPRLAGALVLAIGAVFAASTGMASRAQPAHPATLSAAPTIRTPPAEGGVGWHELTASQKEFLRPLEHDWGRIDIQQQRKWRELTARVPKMSPDERARIQTRMTDWAKLTPEQRSQARLRYQETRQVPLRDRQARWDAYQSLPTEAKEQLAERARRSPPSRERGGREAPQGTSGAAAMPEAATRLRPVAPTLVQARPGATTTSITRPLDPPPHQRTGMPKIAATPEYVNKSTLLPRRGPQAAATGSSLPASSVGAPAPRP